MELTSGEETLDKGNKNRRGMKEAAVHTKKGGFMGAGLMARGTKDESITADEFLFLYNLARSEKAKEWEKDERVSYDI